MVSQKSVICEVGPTGGLMNTPTASVTETMAPNIAPRRNGASLNQNTGCIVYTPTTPTTIPMVTRLAMIIHISGVHQIAGVLDETR